MAADIRYAPVNGARLSYQVHAEGPDRPDLLFVHGYAMRSTGEPYRELLSLLAREFTVYALDLRGHGASASETAEWSLAALADDVAEFARTLGLVRPVYVGHSIGAFTGMFSEIRHPGTYSALCLLATAAASGGGHAPPEVGDTLAAKGRDRAAMYENFAPMYVRAGGEVELALDAIALMDRRVHEAFFADYPTRVITPQLSAIEVPALVLNGLRDVVVPPPEQHLTALGLRLCKEVTFSNEGHMLPLEAAPRTAREILAFCRDDVPEMTGSAR